ncbi:MAG: hypothetical protein GX945_06980 [Lentisphaerae bacterium]|nr:hypothetical protein [Lentisphaerota bacterium]
MSSTAAHSSTRQGPRLQQTLSSLDALQRQRQARLTALAGAAAACALLTALFALVLIDFFWPLAGAWRWLTLLLLLGAAGTAVAWLIRFSRRQLSHEAMATVVEKVRPQAENRLINAVQFSHRPDCSPEFIEALLAESPLRVEQVLPRELYSPKPGRYLRRIVPVLLSLWLLAFICSPRGMGAATLRVLMPFADIRPHADTIIVNVEPGSGSWQRGAELDISVSLAGVLPEQAELQWESEDGSEKIVLTAQGEGVFTTKSKPLFARTRYRVLAGDARSEWYQLDVTTPPGLARWECAVAPPAHMRQQNVLIRHDAEDFAIPAGAAMVFAGQATAKLAKAELLQGEHSIASCEPGNSNQFKLSGRIGHGGTLRIRMLSSDQIEAVLPLPFTITPDKAPVVTLVDTPTQLTVSPGKGLPVIFKAEDDFGVGAVGIEQLKEAGAPDNIATVNVEDRGCKVFPGRFVIDTSTLNTRGGALCRFRVWAEDEAPDAARRRGYSAIIRVIIPSVENSGEKREEARQQVENSLAALLKVQRDALRDTRQLAELAALGRDLSSQRIGAAESQQQDVRNMGITLLDQREALGGLGDTLSGLVNLEMVEVLKLFATLHRSGNIERAELLPQCTKLQTAIISALANMADSVTNEQAHQDKADIFALLQKIITMQRETIKDTQADGEGKDIAVKALAHNQDQVAESIMVFSDQCLAQAEMRSKDDFAIQLRNAYDIINQDKAYEKALQAAEDLSEKEYQEAIVSQKECLAALMKALNILNHWRVDNARKIVDEASAVIKNVAAELDGMEKKQARIAEVTRDFKARGVFDDEVREQLAKMDKEQKEMADLVEQLANDLYQFPELPVCNELNSKMREVFEDVMQALDSENLPSIEIAVQKEDALLDAIRNTKERIEDVEMWLPDVPDHFVWNMESFDTDEMPDIPLVPLPDELEDIVGELLEQAAEIDMQSQDTTGNNIIADMEMGWAVMDGPMPSFSAKGKSGNTRPNDNEMTGRSGSGREGQATGELVENHVKGYEGRETHARRTHDQFQKGMVTEDEDSTMDARATGGGKLGGQSESIGMFGAAPRRDLHQSGPGLTPHRLRQETEVLFATARLLYIGSGGLGEAARNLRALESAPPQMQELGGLRRRVLRRLEDSQIELKDGAALPMPVTSISQTGGSAVIDSDFHKVAEEYRPLLNDYYRSLDRKD